MFSQNTTIPHHDGLITTMKPNKTFTLLAIGTNYGKINIYKITNTTTLTFLEQISNHSRSITSISFSSKNHLAFSDTQNNLIILTPIDHSNPSLSPFQISSFPKTTTYIHNTHLTFPHSITSLDFSTLNKEEHLICTTSNASIKLFKYKETSSSSSLNSFTWKEIKTITTTQTLQYTALAVSPYISKNNEYIFEIIVGSKEGYWVLYGIESNYNGKEIYTVKNDYKGICSVAWMNSPIRCSDVIAIGNANGIVEIFKRNTISVDEWVNTAKIQVNSTCELSKEVKVSFSYMGTYLLICNSDNKVLVFEEDYDDTWRKIEALSDKATSSSNIPINEIKAQK
jgi:hypothetical protein